MQKLICTCDICGKETNNFHTLDLPRNAYIAIKGGYNNYKVGEFDLGVQLVETDICKECYIKLADILPKYVCDKEEN